MVEHRMVLVLVTLTGFPLVLESATAGLVRETPVQVHPVVQLVEHLAEVTAELAELATLEINEGIYPVEAWNSEAALVQVVAPLELLEAAFLRMAHQVGSLALETASPTASANPVLLGMLI